MDIGGQSKDFIRREILLEEESSTLDDNTPLLKGAVDSMGLMQLVAFLEKDFGVEIDDDEIVIENFSTVADIERLVSRKVAQVEAR